MFRRLGLFGRILSIFMIVLLLLLTVSTALIYLQRACLLYTSDAADDFAVV